MNIPSLTPRDIIEVVLKRKWWILASLTTCMTLAYGGPAIFSEVVQINRHSGECLTKDFWQRVQFRSKSCHAEDICGVEMNTNEPASNEPASVTMQVYWAMIVRRKWLVIEFDPGRRRGGRCVVPGAAKKLSLQHINCHRKSENS